MAAINGVVTLDGNPAVSLVVAVSADVANPTVLGSTTSTVDGTYSITTAYTGPVMVFTMQDYGAEWTAATVLALDDYVHPTSPNGYIYKVTTGGTTDATEPVWPTTAGQMVTDGTVQFITEQLLEPRIAGYKTPV